MTTGVTEDARRRERHEKRELFSSRAAALVSLVSRHPRAFASYR